MARTKLVLWDIDGTLVNTGGAGMKAFAQTFSSQFGLHHGAEKMSFAGRTDPSLVREFFLQHQIAVTPAHFAEFFDSYLFWLQHYMESLRGFPCPGAESFLRRLQSMAPPPLLGLLTGNVRLGAEIKLRHFGLWAPFVFGAFGDDGENRNDLAVIARERGEKILKTKLEGEEIVVIGDTPLDIECARRIGAKVVAVATGTHTLQELQQHHPDWAVETLEDFKL